MSDPPTKVDLASVRIVDGLKWLGERRDGFLVGGAVVYGLGYLVWSHNAWRNHLGQLPGLEFQYLMSGLIPALLIVGTWVGAGFVWKNRNSLYEFTKNHPILYWTLLTAGSLTVISPSLALQAMKRGWLPLSITPEQLELFRQLAAPLYGVLTFVFIIVARPKRVLDDKLSVFLVRLGSYVYAAAFVWSSLAVYLSLYPRLPQELGGPEPRCAYVDVVRDELAPQTLSGLAPDDIGSRTEKVIRSRQLSVYFSGADYLLVRVNADIQGAGTTKATGLTTTKRLPTREELKDRPLYELRTAVIRAVRSCAEQVQP